MRDQGSKKYFYGKDEKIENSLSQIEGIFAETFRTITNKKKPSKSDKKELYELLTFVLLTDLRSLTSIENIKQFPKRINNLKLGISFPEISQEESVKITLSTMQNILPMLLDLDYKLLLNNTTTPFLTCDFPIVKYNILYEKTPTFYSVTGYNSKGLIIFLPINPLITIIFFDKTTYKIGTKKEQSINLYNKNEIDLLNLLQIIGAKQTIFFNELISEKYLLELLIKSKKFENSNEINTFTTKFHRIKSQIDEDKLIVHRKNDTFINLKINAIKIHSGSNSRNIDSTKLNLRN